jgi:hypothetical protein
MGIDDESSHPELCSEVADGVTRTIVCLFREPDAGNLPVRFDEREQETGPSQTGLRRRRESFVSSHREAKATAPVLDSTLSITLIVPRSEGFRAFSRYFKLVSVLYLRFSAEAPHDGTQPLT